MDDTVIGNLNNLKASLQAIALPADEQLCYFDTPVCIADELALDFGYAHDCLRSLHSVIVTDEQLRALQSVDEQLDNMSAEQDASMWNDAALAQNREWETVRGLARSALDALRELFESAGL